MKLSALQTGGFAINVHKSTTDLPTYVACGDIPKSMATGASEETITPSWPAPL